jgi:L-threonylcarbamoyladenylate synthase
MMPSRLQVDPAQPEPSAAWLPTALEVLERGDLVALPTETVYGIAARADDPAALERLVELKGRPPGMAFTWHVASPSALEAYGSPSSCARRIAERYWPGPLTLILPGVPTGLELCASEGWTGVRCTAAPTAARLCEEAEFPLVMSSANRHGEEAAVDFAQLAGLEFAATDLLLDGGSTELREASTILRLGRGRFELVREGLHSVEALRTVAGLRLGFACTGNTCRSPMAEGLARAAIAQRLDCAEGELAEFGFEIVSMGVYAGTGVQAAAHAIDTLHARGIDISNHRSRPATLQLLGGFDVVFCLTHSHLDSLGQLLPPSRIDMLELLDPEGCDIPDPVGGDAQVYGRCAEELARCIEARLDDWA